MQRRKAKVLELRTYDKSASELAAAARRRILHRRRDEVREEAEHWLDEERKYNRSAELCDCPFYPESLAPRVVTRLLKIAEAVVARRPPATPFPPRLSAAEKEPLLELSRSAVEVVATVEEVDEVFAQLHEEAPWLGRLTEAAWRQARLRAEDGLCFRVGPLVALGPPGLGKSTWARRLGELLGLPVAEVDVGSTTGVFDIQGSDHRWGGGSPGRLVQAIVSNRVANPLVVVDELERGGEYAATRSGSQLAGLHSALLGLLEPVTARRWTCPYYAVPLNVLGVSWVFTSNSLTGIPAPLMSRLRVVELEKLTEADIRKFCEIHGARMGLDEDVVDRCVWLLRWRIRDGRPTDLRTASRALELARERLNRPFLN